MTCFLYLVFGPMIENSLNGAVISDSHFEHLLSSSLSLLSSSSIIISNKQQTTKTKTALSLSLSRYIFVNLSIDSADEVWRILMRISYLILWMTILCYEIWGLFWSLWILSWMSNYIISVLYHGNPWVVIFFCSNYSIEKFMLLLLLLLSSLLLCPFISEEVGQLL